MKSIKELLSDDRIFQSKYISPNQISFSSDVVEACAKNYCGRYGSCWTCPPGIGEFDELKARYNSYSNAYVYTTLNKLEDSFDFEGMSEARTKTMTLLYEICERLRNNSVDFTALGCGSCDICEECTYPADPCRFPNKAIPAVEACGIDVVKLASDIGLNYNNGANTVTYFCIIFY